MVHTEYENDTGPTTRSETSELPSTLSGKESTGGGRPSRPNMCDTLDTLDGEREMEVLSRR